MGKGTHGADIRSTLTAHRGGRHAAAGIAGRSAHGLDLAGAAGATTGPANGIGKGKAKKGGSLVFGVDAEE